jgi:site-specific DNA-cytosine methylase
MDNKITWAPHVPLIGGFPLGAELALGTPPEAIYSLPGFFGNDGLYVNHQTETLHRDIEYVPIEVDDMEFERKINIIVGTPPCAGLSALNTGKNEAVKGATAGQNEFMYHVFRHGMKKFDADVIMVENAPALSTKKGQGVADALYDICRENGYSLTLYKTSTHFHGIPQRRDRTFAIAWKSETAPIMEFHREPRLDFAEYLENIPKDSSFFDEPVNPKIPEVCGYWQYIKANYDEDPRDVISKSGEKTAFNFINKSGQLEKVIAWLRENGTDRQVKTAEHAVFKFSQGLGIWDGSAHVFDDVMNAVIGRNMADTVHPKEDRSLTIREAMHMMGLPHNYQLLGGRGDINKIAQNVPTCTAKFVVEQAEKFIQGKLRMSNSTYIKQDNWNERFECREEEPKAVTLEGLFDVAV